MSSVAQSPAPMSHASATPWGRTLAFWLFGATAFYIAMVWFAGGAETLAAARRIGAGWIATGLALTSFGFVLRGLRWHFLLARSGARVPFGAGFAIYLAGLGLTATPGKVGETVRSAFLLRHGVAVGTSMATFLVDRLSDVLGVLLLASLGFLLAGSDETAARWAALLALGILLSIVLRHLLASGRWQQWAAATPTRRFGRLLQWAARVATTYVALWRLPIAAATVSVALVAYGLQACIFSGMVAQVAPAVPFWATVAIFAAGTLAGAASMVPGAIGAMELALVVMLGWHGVDAASALAAALCLRAVTFWFGLLLGACGLSVAARRSQ
jgi:glycosyltransferase 2 family protein